MLNAQELVVAISKAMALDITVLVLGPPGCGKSSIADQIADSYNLVMIPKSLSQIEPGDLLGYAETNKNLGRFSYLPSEDIPLEGDELPEGKEGWLLFLDDLGNGLPAVQTAAYRVIQERMVGGKKIHPACCIIAASNREEDGCYIYSFPKALISKVMILELNPEPKTWVEYGSLNNFDYRVLSYINAYPENLNLQVEDSEDLSYPCSRTWHRVSDFILKETDLETNVNENCIAGLVGKATTNHFLAFIKYFDKLPNYQDIIKDPETTFLVDRHDVGIQWACIGMILKNLDFSQGYSELSSVLKYLERGPKEYLLAFLKQLVLVHAKAIHTPQVKPYLDELYKILKSK